MRPFRVEQLCGSTFRGCSPRGILGLRSVSTTTNHLQEAHKTNYEDLYRYPSGRWLWDEEEQLRRRYRSFNVPELQKVAAESVGSKSCMTITKVLDSYHNKIFRLVMEDKKTVTVRMPSPNAGPPRYMIASEVATMELVRALYTCDKITIDVLMLLTGSQAFGSCPSSTCVQRYCR